MIKKKFLLVLYFLQFYTSSLGEKNIWQLSRAGAACFWPLGAEAARKKIPGAGAAFENNPEPEPLTN